MIAKLERTQSNAQQNIEQLQNPTMGVTINNGPTTTEPGTLMRFPGTKFSPLILLLLKHNNC